MNSASVQNFEAAIAEMYTQNTDGFAGETVTVLPPHYQKVKRQEMCLRLVTLLFLMSCAAAYFLTLHVRSDPSTNPVLQHTAGSSQKQVSSSQLCTGGTLASVQSKPNALVTSPSNRETLSDNSIVQWYSEKIGLVTLKGFTYDQDAQALVVPQYGSYYIYTGMNLQLAASTCAKNNQTFEMHVLTHRPSYPKDKEFMVVKESIMGCGGYRTVYLGQVMLLEKGALLKAKIISGSNMVQTTKDYSIYFGAYLI
ncbi:tumor necrosis factor ligand superfamily member 15-like isoform X2 [Hypomesus transpacificus]|uniref:tumor necrosis factor ligand superfamily member 15-like isoform X2 n=1 Tax=Hypomesus transpacificus TaxID=137520 RepID=UPI001F07F311|nr:tumor necrosis factor ligand superfamily member 15-like isoform X2 [Hypomesus transpacificus]